MKKLLIVMSVLMVTALIAVGCTTAVEDETMPQSSGDTMDKEADMSTEDAMGGHEDSVDKEDDMMKEDTMDKEDDMMNEDTMDKEDGMKEMMNEGEMAPNLELMDLDGNTVALSDFKGEKVYLKYWASWCSICLAGLDEVDQLSTNEDFKVVTVVTPDYKGEQSVDDFKNWFEGLELENITVLLDVDGMYAEEFGIRAFPTSIYIGSDGVLTMVAPGHVNSDGIYEKMEGIY